MGPIANDYDAFRVHFQTLDDVFGKPWVNDHDPIGTAQYESLDHFGYSGGEATTLLGFAHSERVDVLHPNTSRGRWGVSRMRSAARAVANNCGT